MFQVEAARKLNAARPHVRALIEEGRLKRMRIERRRRCEVITSDAQFAAFVEECRAELEDD